MSTSIIFERFQFFQATFNHTFTVIRWYMMLPHAFSMIRGLTSHGVSDWWTHPFQRFIFDQAHSPTGHLNSRALIQGSLQNLIEPALTKTIKWARNSTLWVAPWYENVIMWSLHFVGAFDLMWRRDLRHVDPTALWEVNWNMKPNVANRCSFVC